MDDLDETLREGIRQAEAVGKTPEAPRQPPAEISAALLPPISMPLPGGEEALAEPRFDISVNRLPAREFFMGLVEGSPYNMVVHPDVRGKISLTLKNVTLPEVMETVREVYGYEYRRTPTGFLVLPARLQSRIFQVNYLDVKRSGKSQTRVSSGQVTDSPLSYGTSGYGYGVTGAATGTVGGSGQGGTVNGSQIETESETDFWTELQKFLQTLVGNEGGRQVVVSPQSGIVVVRAMPSELRDVESFLKSIQDNMRRQVILEAKILEVTLKDGFQSGINWAALGEPGRNKTALFGQTGGGTVFSSGESEITGNTGILDPNALSQVQGTNASAFGGVFTLALNLNDFNAFIELLETQGNVQVLSSPRISTVNNQKAVIKVGTDEFFVTNVSSTTVTGTTTTTTPTITLTPFFSGIALDVTPQIDDDGNVILHIHPTVSEVKDQTKKITVGGQTQELPLAFSSVRESDSIVRAKSGQVVVIGGLMQKSTTEDVASTPGLGDLPLVGGLFRHTRKEARKSELVILLRPVVVEDAGAWTETLRSTAKRFRRLNQDFHTDGKRQTTGAMGKQPAP